MIPFLLQNLGQNAKKVLQYSDIDLWNFRKDEFASFILILSIINVIVMDRNSTHAIHVTHL